MSFLCSGDGWSPSAGQPRGLRRWSIDGVSPGRSTLNSGEMGRGSETTRAPRYAIGEPQPGGALPRTQMAHPGTGTCDFTSCENPASHLGMALARLFHVYEGPERHAHSIRAEKTKEDLGVAQ